MKPTPKCIFEGCENLARYYANTYCQKHYLRHRDRATMRKRIPPGTSFADAFWANVAVTHPLGCWHWTGAPQGAGYGYFAWPSASGTRLAHRIAYEILIGPIPSGLTLDHLCRNRLCVNPDHLEAVTHRTNTLRGYSPAALQAASLTCVHGHSLAGVNVYTHDGKRYCRTCRRERNRDARRRRVA